MTQEEQAVGAQPGSSAVRPIFLLSIQRSGSTLLQRLLATHPEITTVSEPWILLPLVHTMHPSGVYAEYSHRMSVTALEDFVLNLPSGWETYREELRRFVMRLYVEAAPTASTYFLDKSPRYALIIDDLVSTFPDARFIVLWRNPLAVAASVVETWAEGRWKLETHKIDLYDGLFKLVAGYEKYGDRFHALKFEDLLEQPEESLDSIFSYLGLRSHKGASRDFTDIQLGGRRGDPVGTETYENVSREPLAKWPSVLNNPFRRSWSKRYLELIGRDRLELMGYNPEALLAQLDTGGHSTHLLASDLAYSLRSSTRSLFETVLLREKLKLLPRIHSIHQHR